MPPIINSARGPAMVFLSLFMVLFATLISGTKSALAWNMPQDHDIEVMSDLLVSRVGSESAIFVKAKQIIQELSSSSTCSYGPTFRLIQQCKNIKPRHENPESEHQINNAQSVYAISMALCEAKQAQIDVPQACRAFRGLIERVTDSIEIIRPNEISACSAILYDTPSWTSYSTFKSNSKFLCDSSRTDYRQEELLQTLQDVTGVIPEILEALSGHQLEAQLAMSQLRETAFSVGNAQEEIMLRAQEQELAHSTQMTQIMHYMEALQETMAEAAGQNSKVLDLSTEKASAVEGKLVELYGSFAEAASGLTFDFEQQINGLSQQISSVVNQIYELGTQEELDQIRVAINTASHAASVLSQIQTEQLAASREVLHAFTNFTPDQLMPKWFGQVSTSIATIVTTMRSEGRFVAMTAAPALGASMFGRHRIAASLVLSYVFARSIWSYTPSDPVAALSLLASRPSPQFVAESVRLLIFAAPAFSFAAHGWNNGAVCMLSIYLLARSVCDILHTYKYTWLTFLSDPDVQSTGLYILGTVTIGLCALVALMVIDYLRELQESAPCHVLEKPAKRAIKEDFERSRRACSVPLDCNCA